MTLDIKQEAESFFGGKPVMVYRDDAVEFAKHCVEIEPVATVAEVHMSRYTLEWTNGPLPEGEKLYTEAQMIQLGEACAALLVDSRDYALWSGDEIRNLIKEMLG